MNVFNYMKQNNDNFQYVFIIYLLCIRQTETINPCTYLFLNLPTNLDYICIKEMEFISRHNSREKYKLSNFEYKQFLWRFSSRCCNAVKYFYNFKLETFFLHPSFLYTFLLIKPLWFCYKHCLIEHSSFVASLLE